MMHWMRWNLARCSPWSRSAPPVRLAAQACWPAGRSSTPRPSGMSWPAWRNSPGSSAPPVASSPRRSLNWPARCRGCGYPAASSTAENWSRSVVRSPRLAWSAPKFAGSRSTPRCWRVSRCPRPRRRWSAGSSNRSTMTAACATPRVRGSPPPAATSAPRATGWSSGWNRCCAPWAEKAESPCATGAT